MGCCLTLMILGERGGRILRAHQRQVLLPLASSELQSLLLLYAQDQASNGALHLAARLTAEDPEQRANSAEMRSSPFLQAAIDEAELVSNAPTSNIGSLT